MSTTITLKRAAAEYIQHLEATGQRPSTVGTAKRSLDLLIGWMNETKAVDKILPVHIANFFKSEAATMQPGKEGTKPRAQASILQIRRIVRSALVWWHEQGYSDSVALPKDERKFLEPRGRKASTTPVETTDPTETTTDAATEPATDAPAAE
jgi:hypothetical protein